MKPHHHLAIRAVLTAGSVAAFVVGVRMAYENANTTAETASVIAAGVTACLLAATLSLLISAALSYGWNSGRAAAIARYEAGMKARIPLGPDRGYGYRVKDDEPNEVYEELGPWRPTEAATEAADVPDGWAQLLAAVAVDEAEQVAA